ncbi:MAG: hypothetical protein U0996_20425 [Planctomycetaceae bacterium]
MIAIRQFHEHLGSVLAVPAEAQNRRTEVIFLVAEDHPATIGSETEGPDLGADAFCGAIKDFPERAAQGEYETRQEF